MIGALCSFSAMALAGRELSDVMSVAQLLFMRSAVGVLIITFFISRNSWQLLKTQTPGLHLCRNLVHFGGQFSWFYALAFLPLAELFALEFTTPIWCLLLAPLILGERVTPQRIISVLIGFVGILIILRPGIAIVSPAALIALAGAVGFAMAYMLTKKLSDPNLPGGSHAPLTILFYMCLMQMLFSLIPATQSWNTPEGIQLLWILVVSVTSLSAHYCIARAMQKADATLVVPMDFMRLPLIALLGYLLYDEQLELWVIIGAAIMLAGNYLNVSAEQKRLKRLTSEAVSN